MRGDNQLVLDFLKSKYFSNGEFMEGKLGPRPSWFWRGCLKGRDILKEGLKWRVGDGQKVKIWDDFWVAKKVRSKLWSPRKVGFTWVKDLISQSTNSWDTSLVKSIFNRSEAESILATPISKEGCEDRIVWHYEKSGLLSVKYAYRLAVRMDQNGHLGRALEGDSKCTFKILNVLYVRLMRNLRLTSYFIAALLKLSGLPLRGA
ncbi:hypothetical protein Sjap_010461 [Stephania japonica]|uniref:Reverse transcriptase n=1 Tax=Stephania japonica TaxID=461633 RepID=A0AAP0J9F8_9MAGN